MTPAGVCTCGIGWPGCSGPMRYGRIISLSSCSTMWQCQTNWPGVVELRPDAGDLARVGDDRVLEAGLPRLRRRDVAVELDRLHRLAVVVEHESLAVHHLEDHLVDVHRVRVGGGVVELPDLGRADRRVLGDRLHPHLRRPACRSSTVPSSASTGPSTGSPSASKPMPIFSMSASGRVTVAAGSGAMAGSCRNCGGVVGSGADRRHDAELHDLAGAWPGRRPVEVDARHAAAERLVRARRCRARSCRPGTLVKSTITSARSARPISSRLPQRGEVHRRGQEAALVADLPDLDARDAG